MTNRWAGAVALMMGVAAAGSAAAQTISVRTVEDRNHVTVMQFSGIYDRQPEANRAYEQAVREAVAKEFYRTHTDDYDFIVTITRFPFAMGSDADGAVGGRYYQIKNDVSGIGLEPFDFSAQFGSSGALQGYIDMGPLSRLATNPTDPRFEQTLSVLAHEMLHRWGAHVRFRDADGSLSTALLGKDGAHWSSLAQSYNSVLYGHEWRDNGDGTFTSVGRPRTYFSPLDLYLMGILDRTQVPPFFVIESPDLDPAAVPEIGVTITGVKKTVTIDDVIAAEGDRIPAAADAPKRFKMAFVFLVRPGETADGIELAAINAVREAFTTRALILTGGDAVVEVFPDTPDTPDPPPPPILPPSSGPRTAPIDLLQGLDWLLSRQRSDGSWADSMSTRVRDSSAVFDLLREVPAAFAAHQRGLAWLARLQEHQNVDMVARRLLAIRPQFSALDTAFLAATRNARGGWGLGAGYRSDPLDSALALLAMPQAASAADDIAYLVGAQNADGGWSLRPGGASSVQTTLAVLQLGEHYAGHAALDAARARGLAWLQGRQNPDGGFGEHGSTAYDTAQAALSLVNSSFPKPQLALALEFLEKGQLADGSWNESVFETALAIRALKTTQLPNALVVPDSVTVSAAAPIDGEAVTVSAVVANESVSDIGAAIVSLFDGDPAAGGVQIGADLAIGALPALTQVPVSFLWDTTGQAGPHTLFVVIDRLGQIEEFDEADNVASAPLTVRPPPLEPDLSIAAASLVFLPAAVQELPQAQTVSAVIVNAGQTAASDVMVWLYEGDPALQKKMAEAVVSVAGRSSTPVTLSFTVQTGIEQTYVVVVDPQGQVAEADEGNNRASRVLPLHGTHDFQVRPGSLTLSASPIALGHDLTIAAEIVNRGTTDAFSVPVRVFIDDPAGGPIDVATLTLSIPAGGTVPVSALWRTSRPLNDVPVIVQADPANDFPENSESNNGASASLTVSSSTEANLRVTHHDLSVTTPVLQGGAATVSIPVRNNGFADAANVTVDFYLGLPGQGGVPIGQRQTIASLPAGSQATASVVWSDISTFGDKIVAVVVDAPGTVTEFDEQDNTAFTTVDVLSLPDLAVSSASLSFAPPFPRQGEQVTVSAVVSNLGEQAAPDVSVRFFAGAPGSGTPLGAEQIVQLPGGGHATASVSVPIAAGAPVVFVQVDAANQVTELDETNNLASRTVGVQDGSVYFTNRFLSPNGDGVQDRTEFFFRLSEGAASAVHALNQAGDLVREFEIAGTSSGSVEWDGRDGAGRIVADGEYLFTVRGAADAVLASATAVVDNNNLPVGEAAGTRYLLNTNLTADAQGPVSPVSSSPSYDHQPQAWLADDSGLLTTISTQLYCSLTGRNFWIFCRNYQHLSTPQAGAYVTSADGRTRTRITPDTWTQETVVPAPGIGAIGNVARAGTWVVGALPSPDGQKILVALRRYRYYGVPCGNCGGFPSYTFEWTTNGQPSTTANAQMELWAVNADGSGLVQVGIVSAGTALVHPSMPDVVWSPDNRYISIWQGRQAAGGFQYSIEIAKSDGSGTQQVATEPVGTIIGNHDIRWSPDSKRLLYNTVNFSTGAEHWYSIFPDGTSRVEFATANRNGNPFPTYAIASAMWLDDQHLALLNYDSAIGRQVLLRFAVDGPGPERVSPEGMYVSTAVPRPGGGVIAFTDWAGSNERQSTGIWTMDAEGRVLQVYSATPQNRGIQSLHWSHNERLAFVERVVTEFRICPEGEEGPYYCGEDFPGVGVVDVRNGSARMTAPREVVEGGNDIVGFFPDGNAFLVLRYDPDGVITLLAISADDGRVTELIQAPETDYLQNLNGVRSGFTSSGKYFLYWSPQFTSPRHLWVLSSLLNLTADLTFQRDRSQLVVRGTAEDRNFLNYTLDAAPIDSPEAWFPIAPPSDVSVINGVLATWIPPSEGTFIVRLTATDQAGNRAVVRRRITWGLSPTITNVVVSPRMFSPNGDGVRDTTSIDYVVLGPVNLEFTIFNAANLVVRTIAQSHSTIGPASIAWDGRSDAGQVVPDGVYRVHVLGYDFFVTVDTTPPDVGLSLGSAFRTVADKTACVPTPAGIQCTRFPGPVVDTPVHDLAGRAVDAQLASWTLESGIGVNPGEWVALDQGSDVLGARDARNQLVLPAADTILRSFTDPRTVVARRYRLRAVDQAGNEATAVSDLAPQEIIVHAWDGVPVPTNRTLEQVLGPHQVSVVQTVRAPLQHLRVQTRLAGSAIWADQAAISLPAAAFDFAWNNSNLAGGKTYDVRLAGRDINHVEYFSNPLTIHSDLFELTKAESSLTTKTSLVHGLSSLSEELDSLQLVLAVAGDPNIGLGSPQYTDEVSFTIAVAPDPALDACSTAAVPARLKGVGRSGRIYYSNVRNVTRFGLQTRSCTSVGSGAILELFVDRLVAPNCTLPNPQKVRITIAGQGVDPGSVTLSIQDVPDGLYNDTSGLTLPFTTELDTSGRAEGTYLVRASGLTPPDAHGSRKSVIATRSFVVDRAPPTAQITYPTAHTQVCPAIQGSDAILAIEGIAEDPNFDRYEIEWGTGDMPSVWNRLFPLSAVEEQSSKSPRRGVLANWNVTHLPRGTYSICLKVFDKGGNATCHQVTFELIGGVSLQNVRTGSRLISPNGDGELDSVEVSFVLDVPALVTARVYAVVNGHRAAIPARTILSNAQHLAGANALLWDGLTDQGMAAADGRYEIVLTAADACAIPRSASAFVEVDRSPPEAAIASPDPGDINRVLVDVRGSVGDVHLSGWVLDVGAGSEPTEWTVIATGRSPIDAARLGQWNNRGQAGAYTVRLAATDAAGNRTETRRPLNVTVTAPLISSVAGEPLIFSPNGDGRLDALVVDYVTTAAARVTVEVLSADAVVATLLPEYEAGPGAHAATWRGLMSSGEAHPDQEYTIRVTATAVADPSRVQSEQIAVVVDTTAPSLAVAEPGEAAYVRGDVHVSGTAADVNIDTYSVRYGTVASGPIVVLDEGQRSRSDHAFGTLTGLADGSYVVQIAASDTAQNTSTLTRTFTIDGGSPGVALTSPQAGAIAGGDAPALDVRGSVSEPNLQQWTARFGPGLEPASWTPLVTQTTPPASDLLAAWDTSGLADGIYTVSLVAVDRAGGTSEARAHVVVDHTAPTAAIREPANGTRISAPVAIRGDATDANFAGAALELSQGPAATAFQFAPLVTLTEPIEDGVLFDLRTLPADGVYTLRLTVIDDAGQRTERLSTLVIDTESPAAPADLVAALEDRQNARLTWTASTDSALAGYLVYRGGQRLTPSPIPTPAFLDTGLSDGTHRYIVRTVDAGGLESGPSNEASVTVDLTPPMANIQSPAHLSVAGDLVEIRGTASSSVDFRHYLVLAADGVSPPDSAFALVRQSPAAVISGLLAQIDTLGRPAGTAVTVRLVAEDLSGNVSTDQVTFTVDNQPPATPALLSATAAGSTVTVLWQGVPDADVAGYLLYNNSLLANARRYVAGNLTPYLLSGSSFADAGLADGDYEYFVIAVDRAGNMSAPSNAITATVETRAPRAAISQPANGHRTDSPVALVAITPDTDVATVQFEYRPELEAGWAEIGAPATTAPYTATWDPRALALGTYQFRAVATDVHGNVDPAPPIVAIVHADVTKPAAPANLTTQVNEATVSLSWTASTSEDVIEYTVYRRGADGLWQPIGAIPAGSTAFDDPDVADGAYAYALEAVDVADNRSVRSTEAAALVYAPLLHDSAMCVAEPAVVVNGSGGVPGATATLFTIVDGVASAVATSTVAPDGAFQFAPVTLAAGANHFTVQVVDGAGNRSRHSPELEVTFSAVPGTPSGLSSAVTGHDVVLTWAAAEHAAQYRVLRGADEIGVTSDLSFEDVGVPDGRHLYSVVAINACGAEGAAATLEVTVGDAVAPAAPAGLTAVVDAFDVTLQWVANTEPDLDGYYVYRRTGAGEWTRLTADPLTTATFVNARVPNGTYRYRVTAVDEHGNESGPSNEAEAVVDAVDATAPSKPEILAPTDAAHPIAVTTDTVAVSGLAEPASTVKLLRDGIALATATASDHDVVQHFNIGGNDESGAAVHPSGLVALFVQPENSFFSVLAVADVRTQQTRFFESARGGDDPAFTPDGSQVLFSRFFEGFEIAALDLATGAVIQRLPLHDRPDELAVSPDGGRVAMALYDFDTGTNQLWMMIRATGALERLTVHRDGVEDLAWSPDGNSVAYATGSILMRIMLADAAATIIDTEYSGDAVFSPDGATLAYSIDQDGRESIRLQHLASGDVMSLPPVEPGRDVAEQKRPVFSPDGAFILAIEREDDDSDEVVWRRRLGTTEAELVIVDPPDDPFWITDRTIVFVDDTEITRLVPPGYFAFADVAIEPGVNRFSAIAIDASGNTSPPADPISLTRETSGLGDLVVRPEDVFVYPLLPTPGEQVRVAATIRNAGSLDVDDVTVTFLAVDEQGTASVVGALQSIGSIAAGANASASVYWTAGAGRHRLQVVVDPLGTIREVSEANNRAERAVEVPVPGTPAVYVTVDQSSYSATGTVRATVTALNPTAAADFVVEVTIEDAQGHQAASLLRQTLTPFAYGRRELSATWAVDGSLAGEYRARASLTGGSSQTTGTSAPFSVLPDERVTLSLTTDRAVYADGDTVRIAGTVRNDSANVDFPDVSTRIEILGPGGAVVQQFAGSLGALLIGAQAAPSAAWQPAVPGSYVARLTAYHGTRLLGEAARSFSVAGTARVGSALSVARPSVPLGDDFDVTATVTNSGSLGSNGLVARLRVVDPATQSTIRAYERSVDLAPGASVLWPVQVNSAGLSIKSYTLALAIETPGPVVETLATATAGIAVLDLTAPVVLILSPAPNQHRNADVTIVARVIDELSPVTRVELRIDEGEWQQMSPTDPAAGTFSFVVVAGAASEGAHTIAVRATDSAGNGAATSSTDANPVTLPLTIDVTPPQILVAGVADGGSYQTAITPTVDVTDSALATTSIRLNGEAFVSGTTVDAPGTYTLSVSATDRAGNQAEFVAHFALVFGGPPVAGDQSITTDEDAAISFVLDVVDPDGDPLTFTVTPPAHGTLSGQAPSLTYTPAANFHGTDQFTFTASDGTSTSNTATVTLHVTAVNDPPSAHAGSAQSADEGAVVTLDGSASADADGDTLTFRWTQLGGVAAMLDLSDPARPAFAAPRVGRDGSELLFELIVNDGTVDSSPAQVAVSVRNVNQPPRAEDHTVTVDEDSTVSWTLPVSDPDDDPLAFEIAAPAHGAVTGTPPNLTYTPAADFHGHDTFAVTIRDDAGLTATATVTVIVVPVNDVPVANAGADATALEGDTVTLDGAASTDADGDALTFAWTQIAGPAVTLHGADTAAPTFTAPDVPAGGSTLSFSLIVADAASQSAPATVNVTVKNVNHAPLADAGSPQRVGGSVTVVLDGSRSYDPDGDALSVAWQQVSGIPVVLNNATTVHPSFVAPVVSDESVLIFELTVSDGLAEAVDQVTVTVDPANQAPIADAGVDQVVDEGTTVTLDGRASRDPDGDQLRYVWSQVQGPPVGLSDHTLAQPQFVAPMVGPSGETLAFELVVNDGVLDSAPDRVSIRVVSAGQPPVCSSAVATPSVLWPPNHKLIRIRIGGLAGDPVIRIVKVTQDEPVKGTGDGDTAPDAVIDAGGVSVRAERSGRGNGRVYRITFTAEGQTGASCTGTVTVAVPHDPKRPAVDDGQKYDSTARTSGKKDDDDDDEEDDDDDDDDDEDEDEDEKKKGSDKEKKKKGDGN